MLKIRIWIAVVLATAFLFVGCTVPPPTPLLVQKEVSKYTLFLPTVHSSIQKSENIGVETEGTMRVNGVWYNPKTRLKISARWSTVESTRGVYNWGTVDAKLYGYPVDWIDLKMTPEWALNDGDVMCQLPKRIYYANAAFFAQALIDKYEPVYLEVWNEPNPPVEIMNPDHYKYFGCIGNGWLYGEFVKYIYDHTHGAKIIAGAVSNIYDEPFVSDMLQAMGDHYDGLSFHCYPHYYSSGFMGDACPTRYVYARGLTSKPVYVSETGVMYRTGIIHGFETAQITHFSWLKTLPTPFFWYTVGYNGWPQPVSTDMIARNPITNVKYPRPVWYEYINSP